MSKVSIINKYGMICPRCEERNNLLKFTKLNQVNARDYNTVPIYKCPECRYVFAPLPDPTDFIND